MLSYRNVQGFRRDTSLGDDTKVKPKKMAADFSAITNDIKNLSLAVSQYAQDWGQVGTKVSSSDWAEYADSIVDTSENISEALANAGSKLMQDINEIVDTMSGFSQKEASQLDAAKTQMASNLSTLQGLGGK